MEQLGELTPEDLELIVLSSMTTHEKVAIASGYGVRDESWQIESHSQVWKYISDAAKVGKTVTSEDIKAATGVTLLQGYTDNQTFLEELLKRTTSRMAVASISERSELFKKDPQKAIELLIGDLSDIVRIGAGHTEYFDGDILRYVEIISERAESLKKGKSVGIRTGLKALDSHGDTYHAGDVVAIQGPLNVGKSTLLLWTSAFGYHFDKKKVLFLTPESTISDIQDKLHPMIARFRGYDFSNKSIRNGTVDLDSFREYATEVALDQRSDWITRDAGDMGSFEVPDILSAIREHRPDIVAIDGVHLIGTGENTWQNMRVAAKALKGIAQQMGIVIIGGTQVQRDAVTFNDEPAGLGQTGYGMAFVEAANKVISLGERKGDPMQRVWKLIKNRDGRKILERQFLKFDVDRGDIGDLIPNEDLETGFVDF